MIDDANRVYDGYSNLVSGVDGGRRPNLIDRTQCAEAENLIFRGAAPSTRPSLMDVGLTFDNPDLAYAANGFRASDSPNASMSGFRRGKFQGAHYFSRGLGKEHIMASINGRLYRFTPGVAQTGRILEIGMDFRNSKERSLAYMIQAGIYFIVQDGESLPIIFDGVTARRSMGDEIFTGTIMGTGMGRIVLVGTDGQIYFGDIRDGTGNGDYDMLLFTETKFLNEGFPTALPAFMGEPTAIQFVPQQDTATGVGECLVFGERGVESFFVSIPREQWKDSAFQRTALLGIGATGHRATTLVNADIGFRSFDGWRSYRQARAEINQWAHIPLSTNVRKWTEIDTRRLLKFASAITFDQRVIFTTSPYPNAEDTLNGASVYHNGLLALDFDVLASFGSTTNPAWDGHWGHPENDFMQGLRVLQLVEGRFDSEQRAFAFVLNETTGQNSIVEIQKVGAGGDYNGIITSRLRTRSMDFDTQFNEKTLYGADVWVDEVKEPTEVTLRYRSDQAADFTDWADPFTVNPIDGVTEGEATVTKDGYDPRHSIDRPSDDSDELVTKRLLRRGFEYQVELEMTGRAALRRFRLHAQVPEERSGPK